MRMLMFAAAALAAASALTAPAAAFDCAKASTDAEKFICSDPGLKAKDDAMGAAYEALKASLSAAQAAMLAENQKAWIGRRDGCVYGTPEQNAECMNAVYDERVALLSGKPESGPGLATPVSPYFKFVKQTKTVCGEDSVLLKFGAAATRPGEKAFDDMMSKITGMAGDETPEPVPDSELGCESQNNAILTYGSPKWIAARLFYYGYYGGAHGNFAEESFVVDLDTGKRAEFADWFEPLAVEALLPGCATQIEARKREMWGDVDGGPDAAALKQEMKDAEPQIREALGDLSSWMVYADKVEVYFPPYAVGAYAEGSFSCTFDTADIKKLSKGGAWITD